MTIKKKKIFIDYEKEEKWLNEMAAKGLHLVNYSFPTYFFEKGEPGEYCYRIQLLDNLPNHDESKEYIEFMEENEVEYIASSMRWVYFRKKATDGPFEIFSDYKSKIKHYSNIVAFMSIFIFINLIPAIYNMTISRINMYVSLLNWAAILLLGFAVIMYMRRINQLKKEEKLYDK
ncbi:DUF2812 domain-containing protein [Alkalihalobacterium chitinilyticum]|uniref:DUF2812 domain-containing protein n=1 Tax=Alkalihalobacterium chitinilyticum TaxID=2980103 RepID=A0ABT5VFY0_9BACI|nr:DUF2812 domain-containing protein [Alkalihalobacterium chitinilyticum]MDE5414339.1 DUF2812 domain-containing protein [Alkalihalobacterium chitinilyticum]